MNWNINKKDFSMVINAIEDEKEKRLWEIILTELINMDMKDLIQNALENETKFLKGEENEPFSPYILRLSMKGLKDYGSSDDISSPLGFLRIILPFKQDDPDYLNIYAPCVLSTLELLRLYGPEVAALYSANINPEKKIKDLYEAAKERYKKVSNPNLWYKIRGIIYKIKHNLAPLYSISTSQHFYQIGIYFYQDRYTKYIGSRSPGIMFPHEYYGEDIYYPGISDEVLPLSIGKHGASYCEYRQLLKEKIDNEEKVENPIRPFYFDEGIASSNGLVKYVIFEDIAKKTLNEYLQKLENKEQDKYINDLSNLVYRWLTETSIEIYFLTKNTLLNKFTLLSSSYIYISERDKKRKKIRRGRVINLSLITQFLGITLPGATLLTQLKEIIEFSIGAAVSLLVSKGINEWIEHEINKIEDHLKNSKFLKELILNNYGEEISKEKLKQWVKEWLQVD